MIRRVFTGIFTLISLVVCLFCGLVGYILATDTVNPIQSKEIIPIIIVIASPFLLYLITRCIKILKPKKSIYKKNKKRKKSKFKRNFFIFAVVLSILAGAYGVYINYDPYKSLAKNAVSVQLTEPKTAQFSNIKTVEQGNNVIVTGIVRDKNEFGGYSVSIFDVKFDENKNVYFVSIE